MTRRLLPYLLAIVAPLVGVGLALHYGTIDLGGEALSGTPARVAALPPAEPEAAPPAWRGIDATEAAIVAAQGLAPAQRPPLRLPPLPAAATGAPAAPAAPATAPAPAQPPASPPSPGPATPSPAPEAPARPAAHNPNVRHATVAATVCRAGYTRRVRPSLAAHRRALLASAAVPPGEWHGWQLDHRVPLALGGAPRDPANLMLQPRHEAERKNRLEVKLQCLVCTGQVPLHVARADIARDWQAAYHRYAKVKCKRPRRPRAA